jgi:uncharacterized protein DUF6916
MKSSRREFLKRGTLGALAAGVPLGLSIKAAGMITTAPTAAGMGLAAFKAQLGTTFTINNQAGKVKATLVDVTSFASRKQAAAGKEGFSLLFHGPKDMTLQQNTYLIEHEELGMFSFLIVPVLQSKDKRGPYYEAVINRLNP